ncbi:MAG: hypothetical protein IKW60_02750 [Clostridia bacterium]|nr:hypothetical protein [Clostridia bacterium]
MKKLFEDKMLKVLSLAIAIVVWLYIFIILDPAQEVTVRSLPIEFVGVEQLSSNGLSIVSESDTELSLKVNGSRKRMGQNNMRSIIAKVDVSSIYSEGTVTLPVQVVVPFENFGITQQDPYSVDVTVERTVEKTLDLKIETESSLATDYMAGPMHTKDKTVTVRGPRSVIGKIAGAGVVLNYGNADVDIDVKVPIRLYGNEDKEILVADPIWNRVSTNISETMIHCTVVKLKKIEVEPVFDTGEVLPYRLNIKTVQIYGNEQITSKVDKIKTEPISTEKLTSNQKTKVKLVVPEGVKILQDIAEVEVTLTEKNNGK